MLKRKFEETVGEGDGTDNATTPNGQSESDDSNCSAGSTDALAPEVASGPSPPKRMKKKVNFKGVTVYYFPRRQGFTCVPSEGGSTLGMTERHSFTKDFSLSDYAKEQKRIHRAILAEQRRQGKMFPSPLLATSMHGPENDDDISSGSESDSEYDDYYFLQPLPIRQRRVLLRTAGVKKIDNEEKDECRDIRVSRNVCGCDCKVFCDPATCSCAAAGIQCQVDRLSFPCGCTKDGCANPAGRIEFNPIRVRTHFIHTLMRLELERKDSESPDSSSSAATTSFLQSSPGNLDIDVVGANGEEASEPVAEAPDLANNDSCSGASTDSSSSSGKLKSKLKLKKAEAIDLNLFNSNEKGSCRDCQNTDMCNVMMHDVKFSMASQQRQQQQQQQQQRAITITLGTPPSYQGAPNQQPIQQHHLGLSPGISLLHLPVSPQPSQPSGTHMLLFNDGEEDVYQAENTTSMYFDNDDSSYSELSDTSPEGLEARPFAVLNQNSFNGKFHMFNPITSNSNAPPPKARSLLPNGGSVMNPPGLHPISTACNLSDLQQPCGLFTQSSSAPRTGQSLPRTPYQQPSCVGPPSSINCAALIPRPPMPTGHGLDMTESSHMLQGSLPGFPSKFPHVDDLNGHMTAASFKLDSSLIPAQSYSSDPGPSGYLSTSSISTPSSSTFGNLAPPAAVNPSTASFETLQGGPCWTTSLVSSSLRECYGPSVPPTSGSGHEEHTLCKPTFQQDPESCALSPTTTYATMTTTTRDLLAAHCPGISSHMDSKLELATSSSIKDSETYPNFHLPSQSADSGHIMFTSPYPDRRVINPSGTTTVLCSEEESDRKACSLSEDLFPNDCIDPPKQPTRLLLPDLCSSEISTKLLPLSSQFAPEIPTLLPGLCGLVCSTDHCTTSPAGSCVSECSTVSQQGSKAPALFYDCATSGMLGVSHTQPDTYSLEGPMGNSSDLDSLKCPRDDGLTKWDCQEPSAVKMSVEIPGEAPELEATISSSSSSAPSSSSSSPNTSEEEKDSNLRPSFGDIMKESLVEMVLV